MGGTDFTLPIWEYPWECQCLRAVNATQKQKRARKNRWIAHDNGLSVREALELEEAHEEPSQAILAPPSLLPRDRRRVVHPNALIAE